MAGDDSVQAHWLNQYALTRRLTAVVALAWIIATAFIYHSKAGDYLETKLADPVNFALRDWFGLSPKQSSDLKILAMDDRTFAWLGAPNPDLSQWMDLFAAVAVNKPRMIVVDAMFSAKPLESPIEIDKKMARVKSFGVPIVTGAFVSPAPLEFKTPLDTSKPWYDVSHYQRLAAIGQEGRSGGDEFPDWLVSTRSEAYGPSRELQGWFDHVGHIQLFDENRLHPFMRLGANTVLPHIALFTANRVALSSAGMSINGRRIALDRRGALQVNFPPQNSWKIQSLLEALEAAKVGKSVNGINAGDTVLILPLYFTGNTDFKPSPFGMMPGGLYIAAMVNSILSDQWVQPILATEVITLVCLAVVAMILPATSTAVLWGAVLGALAGLFAFSQFVFMKYGWVVPWLLPSLAVLAGTTHLFILKTKLHERKVLMLRTALEGAVDSTRLDHLLRRPDSITLEPRERVVTLMFIDVVGFSMSAENMQPRVAFDSLKRILGDISQIVHRFGGIVDKSLGDGLLCYFGYQFDSDQVSPDHAEQALRCAIAIQNESLKSNAQAILDHQPLYPLRIGLNTASCYLGDIGTANRIEFTVVGNGVNFAKRLEGACEMFSVMMGTTTWELVKSLNLDPTGVSRRMIRIKHHRELMDAYEYDPMSGRKDFRAEINAAFRKSANIQRLNERFLVSDPKALIVTCDYSRGIVLNFSGTGMSVQLQTPLPRGSRVIITLDSSDGTLRKALRDNGIDKIQAEVRWNYQSAAGFVHGFAFQNFGEDFGDSFIHWVSHVVYQSAENREDSRNSPARSVG